MPRDEACPAYRVIDGFLRMQLVFLDGANAGLSADIDSQAMVGSITQITLWLPAGADA